MKPNNVADHFEYKNGGLYWKDPKSNFVKAGNRAGNTNTNGYRRVAWAGGRHYEHQLVWLLHHGQLPTLIDHINGNRLDNRIENLRDVTYRVNGINKAAQRNNKSGYRGVTYHRSNRKWVAYVDHTYIGCFDTREEAAIAYNFAAAEQHGEYARYNTVP